MIEMKYQVTLQKSAPEPVLPPVPWMRAMRYNNRMLRTDTYRSIYPLALALIVGLACLDVWPDLLGHASALANTNDFLQAHSLNGRFFWSAGLCAGAFAISAFPDRVQSLDRVFLPVVAMGGAAFTALYAFVPGVSVVDPALGSAVAAAVTAVGYAWIEVRLVSLVARLPRFSTIVLVLVASRVVKMASVALFGIAPDSVQVPVVCAMPFLAAFTVLFASRRFSKEGSPDRMQERDDLELLDESPFFRPSLLSDPTTAYVVLVACSVLSAVARALSNLGYWGREYAIASDYAASVLPAGIVLSLLVYIAFFKIKETEVLVNLGVLFAIVLGGMFLQDAQIGAVLGVSASVTDWLSIAVELFSQFLFWIAMILAIRQSGIHPYRAIGVGEGAMSAAALLLGVLLYGTSGAQGTLVAASMYGVLIVVLVLLRRAQRGKAAASRRSDGSRTIEEICAGIARDHGLSPREAEVFALLAQGRSRTFIQNELFLSDGTVKTHIRHIYQKLDVHDKQELISLMQRHR